MSTSQGSSSVPATEAVKAVASALKTTKSLFKVETLMAKSTAGINNMAWYEAILKFWHILAHKNARILIISGTHGDDKGNLFRKAIRKDGSILDAKTFVEEDKKVVEKIKQDKQKEILDDNITFKVVDVFQNETSDGLFFDWQKFCEEVRLFSPSSVILAFCFSELSMMNQLLEAEGITANLYLHEDRMNISGKR